MKPTHALVGLLILIAAAFAAADTVSTYSDAAYGTAATAFKLGQTVYVQAIVAGATHTNASVTSTDDATGINFTAVSIGGGIYRGKFTLAAASAQNASVKADSAAVNATVSADLDNDGSAGTKALTIDNAPPAISVTANATSLSPGQTVKITATVGDALMGVGTVGVYLGATLLATTNATATTFTASWTANATEATYTFNVTANDTLGNAAWSTTTASVDATGPAFSNFLPASGGFTSDTTPLTCVDLTDGAGVTASSIWIYVNTSTWSDGPRDNTHANMNTTAITGGVRACWWHPPTQQFGNNSYVTIWANGTDALGNAASAVWNFTVDLDKPYSVAMTSPTNSSYTTGNVAVTFTALDQMSPTMDCYYTLNSTATRIGNVANNTANTTNLALGDGWYSVYVRCADIAGNSNTSATVWFTVDSTPPAIAMALNDTNGYINATQSIGITATVTDANLDSVGMHVNGTVLPVSGTYTASYITGTAGYYVANVTANDTAGNWATATKAYWVDGGAPYNITLWSPASGNYTATGVDINFTAVDDIAPNMSCGYALNGTTTSVGTVLNSTLSSTTLTLSDGNYALNVTCTDLAGNTNTSDSVLFTIDTLAPIVGTPSIAPASPTNLNVGLNITAAYYDAGTGVQMCWYNSTAWVNGSMTVNGTAANATTTAAMGDGTHNVTVTCVDFTGLSTTSAPASVTIDTAAPTVTVNSPTGALADSAFLVNVTSGETCAALAYSLQYSNGTELASGLAAGASAITSTRVIGNGTYYVNATATDYAGNRATHNVTFTIADSTAPAVVAGLSATAGTLQATLSWTASTEADMCGYLVFRNTTNFTSTVNATSVAVLGSATTSYTDTLLTAGVPYYYAVAPQDCTGNYLTGVSTVGATPAAAPFCGDGACNGGESCGSCAGDCGACGGGGPGGGPSGGPGGGGSGPVIDLLSDTLDAKVIGIKTYPDMCGLGTPAAALGIAYLGDRYDEAATKEWCDDFSAARDYLYTFADKTTMWSVKARNHLGSGKRVLIVDTVPKDYASTAGEIATTQDKIVLLNDPVIGFETEIASGEIWKNEYLVSRFIDEVVVARLEKPIILLIKEPQAPAPQPAPQQQAEPEEQPSVPIVGPLTAPITGLISAGVDKGSIYIGLAALLALGTLWVFAATALRMSKRKWYEK